LNDLSYKKGDLANTDFQYLEDISTGYWYSQILFTAVELGIFDHIDKDVKTIDRLASLLSCNADNLKRLLKAMECLALVINIDDEWCNSQMVSRYLVRSSDQYMGHFILYRRYMRNEWQELSNKISPGKGSSSLNNGDDLEERFYNYLCATDSQIKLKSHEILEILNWFGLRFPVLDIGGGAGSLLRVITGSGINSPEKYRVMDVNRSTLFELDDIINAAKRLYPSISDWQHFRTISGDFRSYEFGDDHKYRLIMMSNFLHAYGSTEAHELLKKACRLLTNDGIIVIHDYFPDRVVSFPQKGKLYDLNMMINTYNGRCHETHEIIHWLTCENLVCTSVFDLKSDTSVIVAHGGDYSLPALAGVRRESIHKKMQYQAIKMGFKNAKILKTNKIITASWPGFKCRYGCEKHNTNLKCPPNGNDPGETKELLSEYSYALILEGAPPGKDFHYKLLELEKRAFLAGFYKAFAFIAGPCSMCPECSKTGECRNPKLARPSMEGSGIDVYATCEAAGIDIAPVSKKGEYIKYIGLLLLG
jgi:predicted metal-binding protein